jgi:hypothetical protein
MGSRVLENLVRWSIVTPCNPSNNLHPLLHFIMKRYGEHNIPTINNQYFFGNNYFVEKWGTIAAF